jgi:hypothetical protein
VAGLAQRLKVGRIVGPTFSEPDDMIDHDRDGEAIELARFRAGTTERLDRQDRSAELAPDVRWQSIR